MLYQEGGKKNCQETRRRVQGAGGKAIISFLAALTCRIFFSFFLSGKRLLLYVVSGLVRWEKEIGRRRREQQLSEGWNRTSVIKRGGGEE